MSSDATNVTFGPWEIAGDASDLHQHHHEQEEVWNVVSGAILLVIDGTERRLEAGDAAVIPPSVSRAARVVAVAAPSSSITQYGWSCRGGAAADGARRAPAGPAVLNRLIHARQVP